MLKRFLVTIKKRRVNALRFFVSSFFLIVIL